MPALIPLIEPAHLPLDNLIAAMPDALLVLSEDGKIILVNTRTEDLFGYRKEELLGQPLDKLLPERSRKVHAKQVEGYIAKPTRRVMGVGQELFGKRKDGREFPVHVSLSAMKTAQGQSAIAIIYDTTEHIEGGDALRFSEARYRRMFESAQDGILLLDAETGLIVDVNKFLIELLGHTYEEFRGKKIWELGVFKNIAANQALFAKLQQEEYVRYEDMPLETAYGRQIEVEFVSNVYLVNKRKVIQCTIRDISERKRAEAAVQESERVRLALEAARMSMFDWDIPRNHVTWSHGHEAMWGLQPGEFKNTFEAISERVHKEDLPGFNAEIDRCVADREPFAREFRIIWPDGSIRWVAAQGDFSFDAENRPERMRGMVLEATERKQAEEALRQLTHELEQRVVNRTVELQQAKVDADSANQAKSEFLSRMSHELRTPLNSVMGYAQLLSLQYDDSRIQEATRSILKGGKHLLQMINEVLDLSRIESGRLSLSLEPVDSAQVLIEAIGLVQPMADRANIIINVEGGVWEASHVQADRQRLVQVLVNLLSNSIKYNRLGGTVVVRRKERPDGMIRIEVSDTGQGIAQKDRVRLFQAFERLGDLGVEGTGLGLALSERFVRLMGGALGLADSSIQGSTFYVDLQRTNVEFVKAIPLEATLSAGSLKSRSGTVLYIEDNADNMRLLEILFGEWDDIKLISALRGLVGFELAREHLPDLILLDLHLPDEMGDKVLGRLKADPTTRSIPVVMLSADATQAQSRALRASGATEYLTKPLDLQRFFEVLADFLPLKSESLKP